jgi:hypothetical protein
MIYVCYQSVWKVKGIGTVLYIKMAGQREDLSCKITRNLRNVRKSKVIFVKGRESL